MPINFYSTRDQYGCFSNFSAHGIELDGQWWPTTEHYFQAQKFAGTDPEYMEAIRLARTPKQAAEMGRDRSRPMRTDWEDVKDDVMRRAVIRKFQTHEGPRQLLLGTDNELIVEKTSGDYYWGCGTRGTGQNKLGLILMEVRELLRGQQPVGN